METLSCAGCRRPVGHTVNRLPVRVWCSDWCQWIPPVSKHEPRDHLIVSTAFAEVPLAEIARQLGMTRQRVSAIFQDRTTT